MWSWISDAFGDTEPNEDPDGDGQSFTLNLRHPGQYFDSETRTSYNYFRHYDPTTGRYTTSDPIGLDGGLNPYLYAYANPVAFMDPTGLIVPGAASAPPGAGAPEPNPDGGRMGVQGCIGGCASYTQGDRGTHYSISGGVGAAMLFCSNPAKSEEPCADEQDEDCGMYDPNCDNTITFSPSINPARGAGIGLSFNDDGSVCVAIGPFVNLSPVTLELGSGSE